MQLLLVAGVQTTNNNYKFPLPFLSQSSYYKETRIKEAPWLQKTGGNVCLLGVRCFFIAEPDVRFCGLGLLLVD